MLFYFLSLSFFFGFRLISGSGLIGLSMGAFAVSSVRVKSLLVFV